MDLFLKSKNPTPMGGEKYVVLIVCLDSLCFPYNTLRQNQEITVEYMTSKILEIMPPFNLQILQRVFCFEFSQHPPGCLQVARRVTRISSE